MPSKNLHDAVDDPFQPTSSILCGSEAYQTNSRSYCSFETSETSWAQIVNAQKALPSKNLNDAVDNPFQPTITTLCGSETYQRQI